MKFIIQGRYVVAKIEEKGKVDLYTLIDSKRYDKMVIIGNKVKDVKVWDSVDAEIDLRIIPERIETIDGKTVFVNAANSFLRHLKKVEV
ncbi:hypothetical protein BK749_01600 [Bacillus thuringiensis serovar vazensis]|uniref:Uncharacterized protein n=1 Tax=Bacillus thuringiensis serovar vazensis TaxID=180867 RepID=A0A243D4N3_BACTU|nr:hypothetical protein [Bacillus thuringiensis]EEM91481.1 hypothetical protein bthur0012_3070 [Bacillus thuringiensis serovar pulsiensis BGSC 4CC1]OTY80058.1 hypothetical protein BK749_01600 [Bacillus thuringiensis serovar vazensis]